MKPLMANGLLVRKILYQLKPTDIYAVCDAIFCIAQSVPTQADHDDVAHFIGGLLDFSGLSTYSQGAIEKYLEILLIGNRDKVVSIDQGKFIEYYLSDNNQYTWSADTVRVIDLIAVLFPDHGHIIK